VVGGLGAPTKVDLLDERGNLIEAESAFSRPV
jgi:hypothetical protein